MREYTFEITFTSNNKKIKSTQVIECHYGEADITEMVLHAIKYVFSQHPTANNIEWKLL